MEAIKFKSTLKTKEVKFLGFKYSRVGDIALLKFLNTEIWAKIGNRYNFIGLSYIRKIANRKIIKPKIGKFNDFQIKGIRESK